ncbi:HtaA domain-containing protein [Streptomyces xanthochromogenes]|uniref:HtaA domain-containing protein n=1 Tax=Streptomyces xanthochromogenes TaxID=67384 RepID=UPI00341C85EF
MSSSRPAKALALALLAVVLGAALGALPPSASARAADAGERAVRGGRLDWGIKSSFQSYVTGPVAHGSWSLTGGAATVGGSQFRFHSATGSYDPEGGTFRAAFAGGVHFTGHPKPDGTHELDLVVARPSVRMENGRGTLYADMTSRAKASGQVTTRAQVPLASLALAGIDLKGGSTPIALQDVPATLTSQGAEAFAGYYAAGTALDPVSLSVDTETPKAANSPSATAGSTPSARAGRFAGFADAAVDWGVRRTFREYVGGPVAQGRWTVSAGARDGGALFRFPGGKGTYDEHAATLDATFTGAVRFTGKQLDVTLDRVAVKVADRTGTLSAGGRPIVTFPARLAPKDGLVSIVEAPAELTAEGAELFGGMYPAGTAMDPVSLAVAVAPGAPLPALPDLGTGANTAPSAAPSPGASPLAAEPTAEAASGSGPGALGYAAIGAALVAVAGTALALARKRRTAPAPPEPPTDEPPADA